MQKTLQRSLRLALLLLFAAIPSWGSAISADKIPTDQDVLENLKPGIAALQPIQKHRQQGDQTQALQQLLAYLREKSALRYYFNWNEFPRRFSDYQKIYPGQRARHNVLADSQMNTYPPETQWILPFKNLKGDQVTAYELRHLARQHKSVDMTLMAYYENNPANYLDYWLRQVADLNRAFAEGAYDDAGNGIYENLRGGMRVQNWLFCHHAWLSEKTYNDPSQLLVIKTLLHHGAQLQKRTERYRSGNHHTKGLTALFELSVFFADFSISEKWRNQAIAGLVQHLQREVNEDGFQFERSVHYHIGDIDNYFRVYQLAQINHIDLPDAFHQKFRRLFTALVQLAQPNRRLPVLQDDTDAPYSENNAIDFPMTIGALIFPDPVFRYFSSDEVPPELYWRLQPQQIEAFHNMNKKQPDIGSLALEQTGYYCMRSGWDKNDLYLTISAGLSGEKPDHQHGDMLGIVAYANGREILPNYQVKYNDPDFAFWKNSWVKNVALVDSLPLGRGWKPNEGGSGFGKWGHLPQPQVQTWMTTDKYDYFRGSHNSYDSLGVTSVREVLFVKPDFWIVRDHFSSTTPHCYQQVWQGVYDVIDSQQVRAVFTDKTGLQIIQLNGPADRVSRSGFRDKGNLVFEKSAAKEYVFTTLLYPFQPGEETRFKKSGDELRLTIAGTQIRTDKNENIVLMDAAGTVLLRIQKDSFMAVPQKNDACEQDNLHRMKQN